MQVGKQAWPKYPIGICQEFFPGRFPLQYLFSVRTTRSQTICIHQVSKYLKDYSIYVTLEMDTNLSVPETSLSQSD